MKWEGREQSENVEDRRGLSPRGMAMGGGLGALVLCLIVFLLGGDPKRLMEEIQRQPPAGAQGGNVQEDDPETKKQLEFVRVVLKDTEDVWTEQFARYGKRYQKPKLIVFRGGVESACGFAESAMGPFYCPGDRNVYIDLDFFQELSQRFKAPGDFARAYVIAHEVGHHVQNLLGYSDAVHQRQGRVSKSEANRMSVRLELQADYLAGVWGHHANRMKNILEQGDVEAAMNAAQQIGDDRLQKMSTGRVVPDSFTHGSSAQRVRWFKRGMQTGDLTQAEQTFTLPYEKL